MSTAEERNAILQKVAAGQLSAAEAAELLGAGREEATPETAAPAKEAVAAGDQIEVEEVLDEMTAEKAAGQASWLHIKVSDLSTGKRRVSVNIPLRLMRLGMRLGSAFAPELREVDLDELSRELATSGRGVLVDVEDEDDGHHVQIYVD